MTTSESTTTAPKSTDVATAHIERRAGVPARPGLGDKPAAPVIVKVPAPFFVRVSQVLWITSLLAGAAAVVYMFIIRQAQLPEIAELARLVDPARAEVTYTSAADIVFWSVFAPIVTVILVQIMLQVSFANRRPGIRWWQFASVLFQGGIYLIAGELIAFGERGLPLDRLLLAALGLATLGLLISLLPPALKWTARGHDVRNAPVAPTTDTQL